MTELSIVPAGAGAGKTHHIQATLTQWVRDGLVRPERILAVTFTEAAAGELRQRIRAALIADGNLNAALSVDRAYVSTIHGLGRRLLVEHAFASGASPQLRLIAEDEQDLLIRRAIEENDALNELARNLGAYGYRGSFVSDDTAEDSFRSTLLGVIGLLRTLGPRGADPAMADDVEASIRDGYGAPALKGETLDEGLKAGVRALLAAFPRSLAETATSKTAKDAFRSNYSDLRAAERMFAADEKDWKLWQRLRTLRKSVRGSATPDGYDELADAVMAAADKLERHPGPLSDAIVHARALVEGAQSAMADYEARKRRLGVIDYSDMVTNAAQLLRDNPAVLGAIMEEVDCVIVDEFQDTNPIQFTFLWTLARQAKRALIVGDTKQAIMGFQGADPRLTTALTEQFETSPLDRNWRSDPRIMGFVNALGPCLFGEAYAPLAPTQEEGAETALEVLHLAQKRGARNGGKPHHFVAERIQSLLEEGVVIKDRHTKQPRALEPRDIAVLCYSHNQCTSYASALRTLGLPVRVADGGWWQSRIVQAASFALRYAIDPEDTHTALCVATLGPSAVPLDHALKAVAAGEAIDAPDLDALGALWPDSLAMPVDILLHQVIYAAALRAWCDQLDDPAQMRADLLRFEAEAAAFIDAHRDMREASGFYGQSAHVFLGWLESRMGLKGEDKRPNPSGAEADGIEIVTWHGSKGREWPVVLVACLDQKHDPRGGSFSTCFPGFDDLDRVIEGATLAYAPAFAAPEATERFLARLRPEADETTRRLLYVALTRARNRLIVEWPQEDGADEPPFPITARRLMDDRGGLSLGANTVDLGGQSFSAKVHALEAALPPCFGEDAADAAGADKRQPRFAVIKQVIEPAIAIVSPSKALETARVMPVTVTTSQVAPGWRVEGEELSLAADKGTAIHEAMRILLQRPDLAHRVTAHCRLSEADVTALEQQAQGLTKALAEMGYPELHVEQPLEIALSDGGTLAAIIDLIAEGADGYLIVDHKSGAVDNHAERLVERSFDGPARVSGSAGTGKTVVALHRAVRLARADPARRILLATFSEPLARELASKVKVLAPEASGIVPRITVSDWANVADELFQLSTGRRPRIAGAEALAELIATAAAEADVRGFSDRFLLSEWTNVVDAWGIDGLEAYAQVPRLGRRSPLGPKQRERLWSVFDRVRSALSARGLFTRSSVYRQVAADYRVRTDKPFGAIIVDEAQDLGPAELVFLSAITPGHADALFFAGDLGQRIFQHPFSWKALGIDVRGRSSTLKVCYRTSRQIRGMADGLLPGALRDPDGNQEDRDGTVSLFDGPAPVVSILDSYDAEIAVVAKFLEDAISDGVAPAEIGIFVRDPASMGRARSAAQRAGVDSEATVALMHLAKGLEFRAVAVVACDEDSLPLQSRIEDAADEGELDDIYETERQLLYVACTRARDRLIVTGITPGSEFLKDL